MANLVTKAGFGFLTLNSGLAIYRSWGDPASILFVSGSYTTLLLLFRCLRDYERAAPGSPARERARRAVWPLTTLLTVGFAWKVAAVMPSAVAAAVVWALAAATAAGGFFARFVPGGVVAARHAAHNGLRVEGSYTTLLLLFRCLRDYERAAPGSPARERARPLTTLLTLALGVVNCDMALDIHKAARSEPGSAAYVLVTYAALLALVWLLVREIAGPARGVSSAQ